MFSENVSENCQARHGRPAQEVITAWSSCAAEVSTSRVRAPEEGQCLPEHTACPIRFPLALTARSTEPQPLAIVGRASAVTSLMRHCKNAATGQLLAPLRPPLARRCLHVVSQPLVRPHSAFPRRRNLVEGEPALANHHRGSLPPFSLIPRCLCELLMLTPVLDRTAMAGVGRRTLRSAAASTIANSNLLLCS